MTPAKIDVVRRRLASQYLTTRGLAKASDVVRALGAVQAQDYGGAKWALAQRTRGATNADIERELSSGKILRTHVLRPTWHFVAPEDLRWMLALTAPRVAAFMAYHNRQLELTPDMFRRGNAAIAKALTGDKHLTRPELGTVLDGARIGSVSGQRLAQLMMQAELDAVVCSGAVRGKQFTYALLDERAPTVSALQRDEALVELTRRYFATRGPASARDCAWWSGLTITDVKRGIQIAGDELKQVALDGKKVWLSANARSLAKAKASAHFLPNYDEYFIGFKDRSAIGRRLRNVKDPSKINALMGHVVIVDGQLVGGWKRTFDKQGVTIVLDLLVRTTAIEKRNLEAAARRFGEFVDAPVELRGLR